MKIYSKVNLPFEVDEQIIDLFNKAFLHAAFGGGYLTKDNESGDEWLMIKRVGSEKEPEIEGVRLIVGQKDGVMKNPQGLMLTDKSCNSLDELALYLQWHTLGPCFGAVSYKSDTGWGYDFEKPGGLGLFSHRWAHQMKKLSGIEKRSSGSGTVSEEVIFKSAKTMEEERVNPWGLNSEALKRVTEKMNPIFFKPLQVGFRELRAKGPYHPDFEEVAKEDTFHWSEAFDWAHIVEEDLHDKKRKNEAFKMTSLSADSALLPSAALGLTCSPSALNSASVEGLENALAVALSWLNPDTAKALHEQLSKQSQHIEQSETRALSVSLKNLESREEFEGFGEGAAGSVQGLMESFILSRVASGERTDRAGMGVEGSLKKNATLSL